MGNSIFYDGTCRNKKDISEVMKYLKTKGYRIILGMTYTTLPTALKRLEERRNQFVPESVAKDIYQHMSKNAEVYMDIKDIDEIYLYNNEISATLIYKKTAKSVDCILPTEQFYFDVSKYC
jgi:predicted ABC-type ATPase